MKSIPPKSPAVSTATKSRLINTSFHGKVRPQDDYLFPTVRIYVISPGSIFGARCPCFTSKRNKLCGEIPIDRAVSRKDRDRARAACRTVCSACLTASRSGINETGISSIMASTCAGVIVAEGVHSKTWSTIFSSSRILPGQAYCFRRSMLSGRKPFCPFCRRHFRQIFVTIGSISSRRLRSGGNGKVIPEIR